MFRKIFIVALFATAAGYCFAADTLQQVVTSEVFYEEDRSVTEDQYKTQSQETYVQKEAYVVPTWPIAGSDADQDVSCTSGTCDKEQNSDNIKIVSKIGADLVVENNFNLGTRGGSGGGYGGWSGGANMLHGPQVPVGFDDECNSQAEMPLLTREMLEDDGGNVLAVSRSGRKNCGNGVNGMSAMVAAAIVQEDVAAEIGVDESADAEAPKELQDQVRSWVVASGQSLRDVLQNWCDKEGWDLVWATSREYPIEASAVFKGRFVDVSSALVRNFGRAIPIPYAKFYKGNRVLVISTTEE